ncbi:MAG: methylmalonyl-CoA carboxyltransferase [Gammaproteobacteria bacterium]|jgi:acetyl-CoA carboxylase carboxyltransferase component|nr:methylmalonyl-CoA carboxyltransferase [Gammaproteobacteria bacterium]MBT4492762.1 methylmalonyl-CoA carboxyltransferase [Gammaproteobacteria bacterium]MBT7370949.1 methylmalonyl-CoA carboxyltransferase [Gammaproteobacteria bacterium]
MSWEKEISELKLRSELAEKMGGEEKVARQHEFGKLTIRERVDTFVDKSSVDKLSVDKSSFHEIGKLAGVAEYDDEGNLKAFTPSNFIFGTAEVNGRSVIVSGDDFTVRGGSADASIAGKRLQAEGLATELQLPHIRLVDGMGGGGSVKTIETAGRTYIPAVKGWETIVAHLAVAPSVSLALGSVAGIGAARVATSHYSLIVKDTAQMMIAGPALVDWASQGDVTKEELGASKIHTRNGAIDDEASSEQEAFEMAKRFLSFLPDNVHEIPSRTECNDPTDRQDDILLSVVPKDPRKVYKMRPVIETVVDKDSFFEIGRKWGRSIITGLARLNGVPVAVFAEDPMIYGGAWTADACRKLIRHCDLASTFHLPLVHLVDCPGFLIGKQSEEDATIRFGSQALAALGQATVPFCSVIIRKAFGVAGAANTKPGAYHFRYAWPSGDWGSLPIEGGIEVAYKAELAESDDYEGDLAKIRERLNKVRSPFRSAEYFEIEEIIDPRETRPLLCRWADLAYRALKPGQTGFSYRP